MTRRANEGREEGWNKLSSRSFDGDPEPLSSVLVCVLALTSPAAGPGIPVFPLCRVYEEGLPLRPCIFDNKIVLLSLSLSPDPASSLPSLGQRPSPRS